METLYETIKFYRQTSVIWYFLTEPIKLIINIRQAIKYKSLYPLKCYTSCMFLTMLITPVCAYVLYDELSLIVYLLMPLFIWVIMSVVYVKVYLVFKRFDPKTKRKRSVNGTYEDKDWINNRKDHFIKYFNLYKDINDVRGWILGRSGRYIVTRSTKNGGNNAKIGFGYSGSGKGTDQVDENVAQSISEGLPFIATSTKSDLFSETANMAICAEYENVWFLCFAENQLIFSDGFNPLKYVNGDATKAKNLANCIIMNTSIEEKPDYWSRGEAALMCSFILWFSSMEGEDSLPAIYRFIKSCKNLSELEAIMDTIPKEHPAYDQYSTFRFGDDRPKQQVFQGVGMRLDFLIDKNIQRILEHDDIKLEKLATTKSCCYVVVDKKMTYRPLTAIFFTMAFWTFDNVANAPENNGVLPLPARVIIDEAHATGKIPTFAEEIDTCRSTGLEVCTFTQDLPQFIDMYPTTYLSILNNCGTKMLLGTDDVDVTIPYFQKLCGNFTAMSMSQKKGESEKRLSESEVPLASAGFLKHLGQNMVVVTSEAPEPLLVKKQHYWANHPGSRIRWKNPKNGRYYHAHPAFKDYKFYPVNEHIPQWKLKETAQENTVKTTVKQKANPKHPVKRKIKVTEYTPTASAIKEAEDI